MCDMTNWPVICFMMSICLGLFGIVCYDIPILNSILLVSTITIGIIAIVWFFYEIIKYELSNTRRRSGR